MTSDLNLFRQHLVELRGREIQTGHLTALHSQSAADYPLIKAAAERAQLIHRLIEDLQLLEHKPSEFVKRHLPHE